MAEAKKTEKKDASRDDSGTPSSIALAEVGHPKEGSSDEELNAHAARYAEAKRKARWG